MLISRKGHKACWSVCGTFRNKVLKKKKKVPFFISLYSDYDFPRQTKQWIGEVPRGRMVVGCNLRPWIFGMQVIYIGCRCDCFFFPLCVVSAVKCSKVLMCPGCDPASDSQDRLLHDCGPECGRSNNRKWLDGWMDEWPVGLSRI